MAVREWLGRAGAWTLNIEPGTPWENGYTGSFNGKLSDELLREIPASSGARFTGSAPPYGTIMSMANRKITRKQGGINEVRDVQRQPAGHSD